MIIVEDYSSIYVNARLISEKQGLILKGNAFSLIDSSQINQPEYKLDRVFKYPSYIHQGERD